MSEEIYRPLIEDMVWSYSRLEAYECPYRWYMQYLHYPKLEQQKKFYAEYGLLMHEILEGFYRGETTKDEALVSFMSQFPERTAVGGKPKASVVSKYLKSGIEYLKALEPMKYKMVAVEEQVDFDLDGYPFTGRIDFLGTDEDGEFVIIDNKSRELKPRSKREKPTVKDQELDSMLKQLYIYSMGVQQKYGKLPKTLCFNCFKNGVFIEEPFREEAYQQAVSWAKNKIKEILEAEEFTPMADYFTCRFLCGYSKQCCYSEGGKEW